MNPPTLLRKFMSLFWLKKGYFQLAINKTKSGNREKSSRRRRLNIVLGLLLLMKTCWSFWNLLSTSLVGILLKMVMLKLLIVQTLWELLIQIMIERSSIWGRPLWREKGFGGYLRWIMTWTRRMFPSVWKKKKLKFWFQSSYLQSVPTLLRHHSWHLRLLRNPWNTSCTLSMAASSRWWLVHYWNPREFLQRFKKVVKSQFKIGHEDVNDLMFTGQRVKWIIDEKTKKKSHITVEQSLCVSEPTKVVVPEGLKGEDKCDKDLHTAYRSLLGSINWLQSRTQFQSCYQFSRCASAAASPTIGDCKALNKLCRQIVGDPMELMFWPLQGDPRLVAMPDAAFRNNSDKSSQRAMVIFMAEPGKEKSRNTKGSDFLWINQDQTNYLEYHCRWVVCIDEVLWNLSNVERTHQGHHWTFKWDSYEDCCKQSCDYGQYYSCSWTTRDRSYDSDASERSMFRFHCWLVTCLMVFGWLFYQKAC